MELERDPVVAMWWAKIAMLGHGVRKRSNIFGWERERERECLRRVGEPVWEWGLGVEVFLLSVRLCEKMLNKMLCWLIVIDLRIWVIFWEERKEHKHVLPKN